MNEWNGVVAAFAGKFKDLLADQGGQVLSPALANPDFERLEAEGHEIIRRKQEDAARKNSNDSSSSS